MRHVARDGEHIYIYSMGKRFRVLAVFTSDDETNAYCEAHDNAAVIACLGPFTFVADKYEMRVPA